MMLTNRFLFRAALLALLLQSAFPADAQISDKAKTKIDSTLKAWIKKFNVVGASIALVDHGKVVYSNGYGFSDRDAQTPATSKTIFRIGSCTKVFTALSVMQLQETRAIDIYESYSKYVPELNIQSRFNDNNRIIIRDMLSHVSGLPCDVLKGFFVDAPPDIKWLISELNKQMTISPARYKEAYSNVAFGLLGELVARTSGLSYSEYVRKSIFMPLGMNASFIEATEAQKKEMSRAYVNKKLINEPLIRDQGAGLVHSNADEMGRFLCMMVNSGELDGSRIIGQSSLEQMRKDQISDIELKGSEHFGYGLYSRTVSYKKGNDSGAVTLVEHAGDTYAFHADFCYIPELQLGAVILTNTDNGSSIASAPSVLKIYAKESADMKLNYKYKDTILPHPKAQDTLLTGNEMVGTYNMNTMLLKVKRPNKFIMHQGPAKLVFRDIHGKPGMYNVKAWIFGFIPLKVKGQEFKFVKLHGQIYMKVLHTGSQSEDYMGRKTIARAIPGKWKSAMGKYKLISNDYPCTNCVYMDPEGMTITIEVKNDQLAMRSKGKSPDMNSTNYLDVVNDTDCVTGGIGRGTGELVRILPNGNIYYSGFEFARQN